MTGSTRKLCKYQSALIRFFKEQGLNKAYASAEQFLFHREATKRLEQWNQYWGESGKISTIRKYIEDSATYQYHFREGSFDAFYQWLGIHFPAL